MSKKYVVKEAIQSFKSYKPNTEEYNIKLDANESNKNLDLLKKSIDLDTINLYPDNYSNTLRKSISSYIDVEEDELMVGAGSSELLELIIKTFVNPKDIVLSVTPSFVMYEKYTTQSNGIYKTVPAKEHYETVVDDLIEASKRYNPKVVFLCTPNNPTGFMLKKSEVVRLLNNINSLVVVDEAYMEFASKDESVKDMINTYDNLIVNRTFSKAFALAGARLGYIIANKDLINVLYTIKTPYSVNSITQQLGVLALQDLSYLQSNVEMIQSQKEILKKELLKYPIKVFNSEANFIYIYFSQFDLGKELKNKKVLIRSFQNNYYRITIGNEKQNQELIKRLEEVINENN